MKTESNIIELSADEKQILLHSLGLSEGMRFYEENKINNLNRNYFYTYQNSKDFPFIQKLIEKGLMVDSGRGWKNQDGTYFYVTEKGIDIAKNIARKTIKKMSRSQKRYALYLYCDVEESFGEWLKMEYYDEIRKEYGV